ncbi:uncharacterized protein EDB91DRAFT_1253883 [Suillus paluster]|uniref:uncharacterized protein n=1 Tax=Suillus paluster TaxID=48578 RepID=UPI001B861541|nr:uncharacterized protein EDB91DRAFT_1253883 [Suillus paluster]KAG1727463.1 hypothetical protein EDB91DRAFT_1253883 [Suillus paluster]
MTTVDPDDLLGNTSFKPILADPLLPTISEMKATCDRLINDLKAKSIITHCLSASVKQLISTSHKLTACDSWQTLADHFGWDLNMLFHCVLHECLLHMGAVYTDAEAFKALVTLALPMHAPVVTATISPSASASATAGSSSTVGSSFSFPPHLPLMPVLPVFWLKLLVFLMNMLLLVVHLAWSMRTLLHKHHHNPEGVFCTTVGCNKGDHDHAHCYMKGGGMEGQAPWMKGKKKKKETATAVVIPLPIPTPAALPPSTAISAFAGTQHAADSFLADLSCASIIEVPNAGSGADMFPTMDTTVLSCIITAGFNAILDLRTMTTLIQDHSYFWSYSTADAVTVCTVNHGSLSTSGHGDCVAILLIGDNRHCVHLLNCLHALFVMLNLLSVG